MPAEPVISRHRLPPGYRFGLTALWLAPPLLLALLLQQRGLFDPRVLLPLGLMALPAVYVWREGIDVLPSGIIRRVHVPRYYAYSGLAGWAFDPQEAVIHIWDIHARKVIECRAAHLTDLPALLQTLKAQIGPVTTGHSAPQNGSRAAPTVRL